MKVNCPYCRKELDIMELMQEGDLHAIIKMLNTFGRHAALVCAYTELFGLSPLKMKTKKWRVLLEEMKRLFDSEQFVYRRQTYSISQAGLVEALNVMVHRHWTDTLENHNYLKKIMIQISERERADNLKKADVQYRKKEERLLAGIRDVDEDLDPDEQYPPYGDAAPEPPATVSSNEGPEERTPPTAEQIQANQKRLQDFYKKIGG